MFRESMTDTAEAERVLPASLLAPYVAAAADQVAHGHLLQEPFADALHEAELQLELQKSAMEAGLERTDASEPAGLRDRAVLTLHFTELTLSAFAKTAPLTVSGTPAEIHSTKIKHLDQVLQLIAGARSGDSVAAERVRSIFDLVADLMTNSSIDTDLLF
jgi:hypothetical protein